MTAVGYVDLLIPRGGAGLIRACVENAKVPASRPAPVSATSSWTTPPTRPRPWTSLRTPRPAAPASATPRKSASSTAPLRASSCQSWPSASARDRTAKGQHPVELRLDERAAALIPGTPAGPKDFDTEFLDYILAVKIVDSVDAAIAHIAAHSNRPQRSHPDPDRRPRRPSSRRQWTVPPSTSTAPPASPTAESSALAARWASPPRSSTPGDPWASASCAAISTSSTATVRPGNFRVFPGCITLSVKIFSTGRGQMPRPVFLFPQDGPFFSQAHFWLKNFCKYRSENNFLYPNFLHSPQSNSHTFATLFYKNHNKPLDTRAFCGLNLE